VEAGVLTPEEAVFLDFSEARLGAVWNWAQSFDAWQSPLKRSRAPP